MRASVVVSVLGASASSLSGAARADVITLTPVADAFVDSAQPGNNYGGAGALGVSATGSAQGEFQSVMRFDLGATIASLNSSYGAGNWAIQSISLQLTAANPASNPIFNAQAAGSLSLSWMQNDAWVEGSGNPNTPTTTGITFASLPGFVGGSDEALGSFAFGAATSGSSVYGLSLTPGFLADVGAGGLVSLRASALSGSYLFNSRSFGTASARPGLVLTTTPAPGVAGLLAIAAFCGMARRRRTAAGTRE